ncbi:MAG: hypothetical protein ACI4PO_03905 [Faecousia sp.]
MLKAHIKNTGKSYVKCKATPERLAIETALVIKTVYSSINETSPEAAKEFKNHLIGLLLDPQSPV